MPRTKYKRILLKLSGESMLGEMSHGIDPEACARLAQEIAKIVKRKIEVIIVFGGGNIFRGTSAEKHGMERSTADYIGMLATVMNSLALGSALSHIDIDNRVQSAIDMPKVCEPYIRKRAIRHLEKGRVVIIGAGSGNPFFSTDTAAAMRACELSCDVVIKATKVDGVFDKDPKKYLAAKKLPKLSYLDLLNNKYEVMDYTAVTLCMNNNLPILVLELFKKDNIIKALQGQKVGTLISG